MGLDVHILRFHDFEVLGKSNLTVQTQRWFFTNLFIFFTSD
jgi:hypothetical protein